MEHSTLMPWLCLGSLVSPSMLGATFVLTTSQSFLWGSNLDFQEWLLICGPLCFGCLTSTWRLLWPGWNPHCTYAHTLWPVQDTFCMWYSSSLEAPRQALHAVLVLDWMEWELHVGHIPNQFCMGTACGGGPRPIGARAAFGRSWHVEHGTCLYAGKSPHGQLCAINSAHQQALRH